MREHYWDPRREIRELRARVEQAFRTAHCQERTCRPAGLLAPAVDMLAGPEGYRILLDLPGTGREDLNIHVERGALTISGKKPMLQQPEGGTVVRRERTYGAFSRTVPLPDEADLNQVTARLRHGELEIVIGRRTESAPRRVEITEE